MVVYPMLLQAYLQARKNKRRSKDSVEYELHYERNLLQLMYEINSRTFQPTAYTFIAMRPQPREVFACEMAMRIIHHYIDIRLRPLIENRLTSRTFNNRKGYGQVAAVNQLISDIYEATEGFTKDAWIIKTDIQGYFPNAVQQIAYEQLSQLATEDYHGEDKEDVLWMIQRAIFSCPTLHCYRKSPLWKWDLISKCKSIFDKPFGIGAAIGHLIWQNAMNYYLNDEDHWVIEECGQKNYSRWVDDDAAVTTNKEAFLAYVIPNRRAMLEAKGCTMHPRKFYCQHYTKGVEFNGSFIKMDRVYATARTIRNAMITAHSFRNCVRINKISEVLSSLNSYTGIFKTRNEYGTLRNLVDIIAEPWSEYIEYDDKRKCLVAKKGYRHRQLIIKKYNLKTSKRYARKNQSARKPCARKKGFPNEHGLSINPRV